MHRISIGLFCSLAVALFSVDVTADELLVTSWTTHNVLRVDPVTGQILGELVTTNSGGLSTPNGLDVDAAGNVYVPSADTNQVLRYDGDTGAFVDEFVGPPIDRASFSAFGPDGDFYVCSTRNDRVHKFDGDTGAFIEVFLIGNGIDWPAGLSWKDGIIYVSNFVGNGILRFDATSGAFIDNFVPAVSPLYTTFAPNGDLLVAEFSLNRVSRWDGVTGAFIRQYSAGLLSGPVGIVVLPDNSLFVTSWNNARMMRYNLDTGVLLSTWLGIGQPNDVLLRVDPVFGDFDGDGDVDLGDFSQFALCFGGATAPPAASCPPGIDADFDDDGDVDLSDFSQFALNFTGAM